MTLLSRIGKHRKALARKSNRHERGKKPGNKTKQETENGRPPPSTKAVRLDALYVIVPDGPSQRPTSISCKDASLIFSHFHHVPLTFSRKSILLTWRITTPTLRFATSCVTTSLPPLPRLFHCTTSRINSSLIRIWRRQTLHAPARSAATSRQR